MSKGPRVAILGAGPVGLEAALYAARLELPFAVYEHGAVAENVRQWGHVRLFSPFGLNSTPLGREVAGARDRLPADGDLLTGRDYRAAYLEPLADAPLLKGCIHTGTTVVGVSRRGFFKGDGEGDPKRHRAPFVLLLEDDKGERVAEADVVLDCTGTYGNHRWLGAGGLPAAGESAAEGRIRYGLDDVLGDDAALYADTSVLVVGGGYSAATTVVNLVKLAERQAGTWVIWAARTARTQPLGRQMNDPLRERDALAAQANALATRRDANVEFYGQAVIDSVAASEAGFRVAARVGGREVVWEIERLVANLGYTPDVNLYRELHVGSTAATEAPVVAEPGFYVLGAKSQGRASAFLLRSGFDQVREAFAQITGRPELDLYRKR